MSNDLRYDLRSQIADEIWGIGVYNKDAATEILRHAWHLAKAAPDSEREPGHLSEYVREACLDQEVRKHLLRYLPVRMRLSARFTTDSAPTGGAYQKIVSYQIDLDRVWEYILDLTGVCGSARTFSGWEELADRLNDDVDKLKEKVRAHRSAALLTMETQPADLVREFLIPPLEEEKTPQE